MLQVSLDKLLGDFRLRADFTAAGRQVTSLFGRSGAGKSSLVKMVAGLIDPDQGQIRLGDVTLFDRARGIALPPHRRRIGLVFQDSRLFPHLTVRGNLCYGLHRVAVGQGYIGFDDVVGLLGIEPLLTRRPADLSGGEKQRVAIGRALLSSPRLLLMDEPLAALDGARKSELLDYIARLSHEFDLPILYVSHVPEEILRIAEQMVLLDQGQVVASGAVEEVMSRADFAQAAGRSSLMTVINATLARHDPARRSSHLSFAGGEISVPLLDLPVGSQVRARIAADHVIIARHPVVGLSVRNQLPGRILSLRPIGPLVDVVIDIGCALHAELTPDACQDLALEPGVAVVALIKSAAIHGQAVSLRP